MIKHIPAYFLLFFTFCTVSIFGYSTDANDIVQPMSPPRLVNDFAGMLDGGQQQQLENKLLAYYDSTSTQIYVVTIESLGDYAIDDYAVRLGRSWKIGQKDKNNGVLILLSKTDRKVDIEIGYGLESSITDFESKKIIDELIVPAFRDGNYYQGLNNATDRIISLAQGNYENDYTQTETTKPISTIWIVLFILFIIFIMIKFPITARIAFMVLSSAGSSGGSRNNGGGFGGGGGGSFGGGGSSGSW